MLGGFGEVKSATEEIQTAADAVKAGVEAQTGKSYSKWTAIQFKSKYFSVFHYTLSVNFFLSSVNPPTSSPSRKICGTVRAFGTASNNSSLV